MSMQASTISQKLILVLFAMPSASQFVISNQPDAEGITPRRFSLKRNGTRRMEGSKFAFYSTYNNQEEFCMRPGMIDLDQKLISQLYHVIESRLETGTPVRFTRSRDADRNAKAALLPDDGCDKSIICWHLKRMQEHRLIEFVIVGYDRQMVGSIPVSHEIVEVHTLAH